MGQYLMSVWHDSGVGEYEQPEPDVLERLRSQVGAFNEQLTAAGQWVFGGGLEAPNTATVIRPSQGATTLFDGPYAESKEQMGGFWVIEVPDLDTALELGRQAAAACEGPVEVRPFQNG